jgi:hypothetical protein
VILDAVHILRLAMGLLMFALAAVVVRYGRSRGANAFALVLLLLGFGNSLLSLSDSRGFVGRAPDASVFDRMAPYVDLAIVPPLFYFLATYPKPARWLPRGAWGAAPFAMLALVPGALYAWDHALFTAEPGVFAPLLAWARLLGVGWPIGAVWLAWQALRMPELQRRSALMVAVGLAMILTFDDTVRVVSILILGFSVATPDAHLQLTFAVSAARLAGVAALGGLLLREALRRETRDADFERRALAGLLFPIALGAAFLAWEFATDDNHYPERAVLAHSMTLIVGIVIAYALLRRKLLGVEVKVRLAVKQSTVAAAFVGVYVVVSQGTQSLLAGALGPYLGLAAAGMLVLAIVPLQRFAERFATAVVPVGGDLSEQKLEAYRAALEQAYASDGTITPNEAAMLSAMRAKLGITERDHAVMEHAVRRGGKPAGAGVDLAPGASVLGKYRVAKFLGEGAYGRTYLAEDTVLKRSVVIKALRPERAGDPELLKEAQTIGAIRHPNVVTLYDVEQVGTDAFIVMEHVEGGSLQARLAMGALKAAEFRRVALGTLRALEAVHDAGAVHRDVKPSNVLLTQDGEPKLADFGIANVPGLETTKGTKTPAAVGTIRYMSPEQARGREATPRSDLYSAAATLYEAYAGQPFLEPRPGESAVELQMRAVAPGPFRRPVHGSRALREWFAKALDLQAERRFASARAMRVGLERALDLPTEPQRG